MNYSKIKTELEHRGITIKEFCRKVDITEQGLHQMIRNGSMKIEVLERISEVLGLPVSYWFDETIVTGNGDGGANGHTGGHGYGGSNGNGNGNGHANGLKGANGANGGNGNSAVNGNGNGGANYSSRAGSLAPSDMRRIDDITTELNLFLKSLVGARAE